MEGGREGRKRSRGKKERRREGRKRRRRREGEKRERRKEKMRLVDLKNTGLAVGGFEIIKIA